MKQIPNKIYLQFHGDASRDEIGDLEQYDEQSEVTWCEDMVNDTDIEYQRVERLQEPSALGRAAEEYAEKEAWSKNVRSFSHNLQYAFYAGGEWMKKQAETKAETKVLHVFGALKTALNNMDAVKASFNDIPKGGKE